MKKKVTVTSNPVMAMYGSGACAMIKKVIDVTVSAYGEKKHDLCRDYQIQGEAIKMIISKIPK